MRLLLAVLALIPVAAYAQPTNRDGERAFQRCYSCHSVIKDDKGLSGPNLNGLGERRVGSDPDFEYSKAFKIFSKRDKRWDKALLDRFLLNPEAMVPGNQMGFFGLKDAKEREAIVTYLLNGH